jgi:alpha-glucosidase (family GH31 glycosyl hydrolase)
MLFKDRNLYEEAKSKGYMIYDRMNKQVFSTRAFSNFTAGLLDLTNPDAINWYK